uniref:Uncharacterized protein n=1 Tax=Brassica oleracea var. oleracea TaxID=109376 RepID=A0A0D2ZS36_BRAOL
MKKEKMRLHKPFQMMIHSHISYSHQTPASTSCKSFHRTPLRASNNIGEIRASRQTTTCYTRSELLFHVSGRVVAARMTSNSGSSDTRRASKRSKRPEDAGTSGAGGEDCHIRDGVN